MMKRYFKFSALALITAMAFTATSCLKNEVDDIFNESAADRLETAKTTYGDILTDQGGKWAMEYFANEEEQGYMMLLTFKDDGSVTISGKNIWIAYDVLQDTKTTTPMYAEDESTWEVVADDGPVLTFNTYNYVMHMFSNPEDIPSSGTTVNETSSDETGKGHEGDYEFDIMKYSGDTLYLEGKKRGYTILMTRLPASTVDTEYFNEIDSMIANVSVDKFPKQMLRGADGNDYIITNFDTQIPSFYPKKATYLEIPSTTVTATCVVNTTGFRLMTPLQLINFDHGSTLTIQRFNQQADGSFLSADDGVSRITSLPLAELVADTIFTWELDLNNLSGDFVTMVEDIATNLKLKPLRLTLRSMTITYDLTNTVRAFTIKGGTNTAQFYMDPTTQNSETSVNFHLNGGANKNGETFLKNVPQIQTLLDYLNNNTFELSSDSAINPSTIKVTNTADENSYFYITVK